MELASMNNFGSSSPYQVGVTMLRFVLPLNSEVSEHRKISHLTTLWGGGNPSDGDMSHALHCCLLSGIIHERTPREGRSSGASHLG